MNDKAKAATGRQAPCTGPQPAPRPAGGALGLAALAEASGLVALVETDAEGRVLQATPAARGLLGLAEGAPAPLLPVPRAAEAGSTARGLRLLLRPPDGPPRALGLDVLALPARGAAAGQADAPAGFLCALSDREAEAAESDAQRRALRGARRLAALDPLTGLPNRRHFASLLHRAVRRAAARGGAVALLMIDLDNFKSINDTMRHSVGDKLLQQTAARIVEVTARLVPRSARLVARLGGDEFVAMAEGASPEAAMELAAALRHAIAQPFSLGDRAAYVTASIGVALHPRHGCDAAELLTSADIALSSAKQGGRNRHALVTEAMRARDERRSAVIQALGHSLERDHFRLAFQPQFALAPGHDGLELPLAGAEALVRWRSPGLGELAPAEFVPVAEAAGMVGALDLRVMALVARQLGAWRRAGLAPRLGLNLSAQSFADPSLAGRLLMVLAGEGVPPEAVTAEITETSLMTLSPAAIDNVARLRAAGVGVAVDDFGTGFSSLSYLQRLAVSEVKIDRSFVRGLAAPGGESAAIIRAILGIAGALGLRTVAEGVETRAQLDWLRAEGCSAVQGFLFGQELTSEGLQAALRAARPEPRADARPCPRAAGG